MTDELIRESLYNKYIAPTKKKREKFIGVEIEMPIVNLDKEAVDFQIVHSITQSFIEKFGFNVAGRDENGDIYSTENPDNGDILSYDCSYNNLELSFGKETNLFDIQKRFNLYYSYLKDEFEKYNHTLTGMGVNPYYYLNHNVPIPNGRYRMLYHHLHSYKKYLHLPMYFHEHPEFGTFSSASQVQLDVYFDELALTLNTFSMLEPIKALLFSNSVIPDYKDLICCRDMFWENSTHGINPHNIGMYNCEFSNTDDVLSYIESTSIYCVERGDKYINFAPIKISEYFRQSSVQGEYYAGGEYRQIEVEPRLSDLKYLRTFKFEDLTFRGTIEFRSVCCQPIKNSMLVAAFHIGLKEKVSELAEIFANDSVLYHHGYNATELRKLFLKRNLPEFVNADDLYALAKKIVDLSYKGLEARGFGEEALLAPLYERIENRTNPAKTMLSALENGTPIETIIRKYGEL